MDASLHSTLTLIWFAILCGMLACYVIADGFDLGVGILSVFVSTEPERNALYASINSIWDANETWLVVLGGALFGAFPAAYALILSSAYLPVTAMIGGFILRGAAIEFRHVANWKRGWDWVFAIGSLVTALSQGWILGRIVTGLDSDPMSTVFTVATAVGVVCGYALLGATYLVGKVGATLAIKARALGKAAALATVVAAALVSAGTLLYSDVGLHRWHDPTVLAVLSVLGAMAIVIFGIVVRSLGRASADLPFRASIALFVVSLSGLAVSIFPDFVPGKLTVTDASASVDTLIFMLVGIGVLLPIMLGYNLYQYFVFRGRLRPADLK